MDNVVSRLTAAGTVSKFQTDADISGNQSRAERVLQKWVPDAPEATDFSLEGGNTGGWDQFAANQQLFGAQSTYDESYYTTTIDRSSESYRSREARAARLAREIEGTQSTNQHVREERGHAAQNEVDDEEAKYSGVRRDDNGFPPLPVGGHNKYTPPARRAPSGLPTVPGAPVDSAIVSAQLSRPEPKPAPAVVHSETLNSSTSAQIDSAPVGNDRLSAGDKVLQESDQTAASTSQDQHASSTGGQTEGVEAKVLEKFRQFADSEKQRINEKKRIQQNHERSVKINDLLKFARTFKLKTPVPQDLVGILAKDPHKQEEIVQKAKEESASVQTTPISTPKDTPIRAKDIAQIPPFQGGRGRGAPPSTGMRPDKAPLQQGGLPARGPVGLRNGKPVQSQQLPAPIPLPDVRLPPTGPMADQATGSPSHSSLQTPTSTTSTARFNLNVKASEFRPNAAAAAFNPAGSNAPSSPSSVARPGSVSRAPSPSSFFGHRKPRPASERPSIAANFNTIKKMKQDVTEALVRAKATKAEDGQAPVVAKDYAPNGGLPNAFLSQPRWQVAKENEEKSHLTAFERPASVTPSVSRTSSAQQVPYHQQIPTMPAGPNMTHIQGPPHAPQGMSPYGHQYDEQRMPMMQPGQQMYASPSVQSRQPSTYASPMGHPAQLSYGQQPYFGGKMPMQMHPYVGMPHGQGQMGGPGMMQPVAGGPYMGVPQQYNGQMPMYSPSPSHVYPHQNGYGSPGRAPMMVQQGSQQGHPHAQPMMWSGSAQGGPMGYGQQSQMNMYRQGYPNQYGTSPQQPYPGQQQRAMSGSYGQMPKMMHMQSGQGQHHGQNYGQADTGQGEEGK